MRCIIQKMSPLGAIKETASQQGTCASVFSLELDIVWDPKDIEDIVFVPKVYNQAVKILTQVPSTKNRTHCTPFFFCLNNINLFSYGVETGGLISIEVSLLIGGSHLLVSSHGLSSVGVCLKFFLKILVN